MISREGLVLLSVWKPFLGSADADINLFANLCSSQGFMPLFILLGGLFLAIFSWSEVLICECNSFDSHFWFYQFWASSAEPLTSNFEDF